jgi:hypothetical protein
LDSRLLCIVVSSAYRQGKNVELLKAIQEMMETQIGPRNSRMDAETDASLKEMKAKIHVRANNEKMDD